MNLYDLFHAAARRRPDSPAFMSPATGTSISYATTDELIQSVARRLDEVGVRPGSCVGIHCPSGVDHVVSTYAAWRCGACVMPIPLGLARSEKEQILRTVAVDVVISKPFKSAFLAPFQLGRATDTDLGIEAFPVRQLREHPAGFSTIDAAFVRFTSGTTATAKGVVLSHETICERIEAANEVLGIGPDDRVVWLLSMAYHFAVTVVAYLSFGAGIILPPNHFAQGILDAARRYKGTLIYGSPTHFTWLASAPDAGPLPSLRLAISTTAAADRQTAESFRKRFGLPLTQALGIIEVGLPFINIRFAHERPEAVGQLLPAYELRLKDVVLGSDAREILLRGPGFLDAYYDPWQPRSDIMHDGWFHTGDVASMDEDGCVWLRGRRKDVINVLGVKFFPQEVESVLTMHPAVARACVCGRPDPRMGEVAEARIILHPDCAPPTTGELIAHCERYLALAKVPRNIEFAESLAVTASGKLLHRAAH
jgi:long-chain acyl-CoA synthetase